MSIHIMQRLNVMLNADNLTFYQIEEALLGGEILEEYPDTGRGESYLVLGFSENIPIHIVCGFRGDKIAVITVYVPGSICAWLQNI